MSRIEPAGSKGSKPEWLVVAEAALGTREIAGAGSNPAIEGYYRDSGHPEISDDGVPWCAAFVGACLKRAGFEGTGSLRARSYLDWGSQLLQPRTGAITVLSRGADPALGHVGFWVGAKDGSVLLLGGNQSDSVTIATFALSRVIGYRWPILRPSGSVGRTVFGRALAHVLEMEGGWSDDPFDPGGPTNRGLTLNDLISHLGLDRTPTDVAAATARLRSIEPDLVEAIYRQRYWIPARAEELPPGLALMHFDAAVNHGVGTAARMLQQAVGAEVDGEIGPLTLAAVLLRDEDKAISSYSTLRRARYRGLATFWRFGRGWLRRVDATEAAALALARSSRGQRDTDRIDGNQKGDPMATQTSKDEAPGTETKWWGQSMTIWGAVVTTVATVLPSVLQALGYDISGELIRSLGDQIGKSVQAVAGVIGIAMTIWGRLRAKAPLERREMVVRL